jgi:hypothetical protein
MSEKKAFCREVSVRCRMAGGREKTVIPGEFVLNSGCNRKHAVRLLNRYGKETTMVAGGQAVKIKAARPRRPGNRKGKPVYGPEVVNVLRALWKFHRFKCGKRLAVVIRYNVDFIAQSQNPDFNITPEARAGLLKISPAQIDRLLKPDRAAPACPRWEVFLRPPRPTAKFYLRDASKQNLAEKSDASKLKT